jgi:hypothetical protein
VGRCSKRALEEGGDETKSCEISETIERQFYVPYYEKVTATARRLNITSEVKRRRRFAAKPDAGYMASEKAELLTEALAAIIDLVPDADANAGVLDRAHAARRSVESMPVVAPDAPAPRPVATPEGK